MDKNKKILKLLKKVNKLLLEQHRVEGKIIDEGKRLSQYIEDFDNRNLEKLIGVSLS